MVATTQNPVEDSLGMVGTDPVEDSLDMVEESAGMVEESPDMVLDESTSMVPGSAGLSGTVMSDPGCDMVVQQVAPNEQKMLLKRLLMDAVPGKCLSGCGKKNFSGLQRFVRSPAKCCCFFGQD